MSATGRWKAVIKTPMGDNTVVFELQVDGGELTGFLHGDRESTALYDGKAEGNVLSWSTQVTTPMPMGLDFKATVEGNTISGGAKSPFGTAPFSGVRV